MCAVFGFLDYKGKVSNAILKKLIHYLSVTAEVRGTDATGIAYVRDGSIVTYKKPKPAHKVKLFFPRDTRAVIGHTRFTTQGSEKRNCNNHPFDGHCGTEAFALAHNGVLYNDRELRREQHLPPTPIETDEGWLLIYHGVLATCSGYVYRMGAALLDLNEPWRVKARSRDYILAPYELYECVGDVPNVVFPCAALADPSTGRIAIYYGCADTVTGLAFTTVDELMRVMYERPLQTREEH